MWMDERRKPETLSHTGIDYEWSKRLEENIGQEEGGKKNSTEKKLKQKVTAEECQ